MDFKAKLNELRAEKAELTKNALSALDNGNLEEAKNLNSKLDELVNKIQLTENLSQKSEAEASPSESDTAKNDAKKRPFNSLGEQLQAVRNAAKGIVDNRLLTVDNEVKGGNVGVGADGGFAVQEDFAGKMFETAAESGSIMSRVDRYSVSANSNSAKWLQVDESDITETVFGGVQTYWSSEGHTVAASKPQFREMKLELEKMMGIAYVTDELLQDAAFMGGFYERAFTVAVERLLESAIVRGDGSGKPLGILNSKALIEVAKGTSQAAGTVTVDNIFDMWARCLTANRSNAVWILHPDLEMQLPKLSIGDNLLWMPEGGIKGNMYQTILGRPILFNDQCSAQGEKGDIMLTDLSEYILLTKGAVKRDWSIHVEFLSDQMAFRIILRVNGAPKMNRPIKLKNSKFTRSPYVTLAERK